MKMNTLVFVAVLIGAMLVDDANSQLFQKLRDRINDIANNAPRIKFPLFNKPFTNTEEGTCPTGVNVISHFDKDQYLGKWYEIARYPVIYERNLRCVTAEYSDAKILAGVIVVDNKGLRINETSDGMSGAAGRAYSSNPSEPGKLTVTFTGIEPVRDLAAGFFPGLGLDPMRVGNYWIMDTDYTTYSLVHSCNQVGPYRTMSNWILWRTPNPDDADIEEALVKFENNGISRDPFIFTDQEDCGRTMM